MITCSYMRKTRYMLSQNESELQAIDSVREHCSLWKLTVNTEKNILIINYREEKENTLYSNLERK